MKKNILLLEDDIALNETICDYLKNLDYDVTSTYDGEATESIIYEQNFDLLLLDVNVPSISGFDILKTIREHEVTTPAIFITSLNSLTDLEAGFESGCDDYIRKPFALKELKLRIETILKREFFHTHDDKIKIDTNIYYNTNNDILTIDKEKIQLNNKVAKLLKLFLQNEDRLVSHDIIYNTLWEYHEDISSNALRTYIKDLRKLLGKDKIVSIKKLGYKFTKK